MPLIKKIDVKKYRAARRHNRLPIVPVSQADGTGSPARDQVAAQARAAGFAQDFTGDHNTAGLSDAPSDDKGAHARPSCSASAPSRLNRCYMPGSNVGRSGS